MERKQHNDEVDVFELFRYIKKGFEKIGIAFLRFFNFLMRNIMIIGILLLVGIVAGYFIDKATPQHLRTRAVVTTHFSSAEYLYNSVREINSNLQKNEGFLKKIGVQDSVSGSIRLEIAPVVSVKEISNEEENFFDLLSNYESLPEEERQKIIDKSFDRHELVLFHNEGIPAEKIMNSVLDKIRENPHFQETYQLLQQSLDRQINSNVFMLAQIDSLLANYKNTNDNPSLVYSQNSIDLGNLLHNRMEMQEETRNLQQQKIASSTFLKIIDIDVDQELENTPVSNRFIVFIPLLLLALFFLTHIFLAISKNAKKLKKSNS